MNPFAKTKEIFSATFAQDLEPIVELLAEHGIDGKIEADGSDYDPKFAFNRTADAVKLMVDEEEYQEALAILKENGIFSALDQEAGLREMLGDLDNDELLEIVADARRQPEDQVAMARKLLAERGTPATEAEVESKTDEIVQAEAKPKEIPTVNRIGLMLLFFVIPLMGIAGAAVMLTFTGTDARGNKYPLYSETDRVLFAIVGALNLAFWLGFGLFNGILTWNLF